MDDTQARNLLSGAEAAMSQATDAYADYQNKLLEYRQSTGQKVE